MKKKNKNIIKISTYIKTCALALPKRVNKLRTHINNLRKSTFLNMSLHVWGFLAGGDTVSDIVSFTDILYSYYFAGLESHAFSL